MADDDYAVVVGINRYPDKAFVDLAGPENDARGFADWLRAHDGGQVPEANIALLQSSHYEPPTTAALARPHEQDVDTRFDELIERMADGRVGHRLYVVLAGHGIAPDWESTAMLTANATMRALGHHIPGRVYGRWFLGRSLFDEVVVFMDCCRYNAAGAPPHQPPWTDLVATRSEGRSMLVGLAARYGAGAREALGSNGLCCGKFSTSVLAGLRGKARRDGRITGSSLRDYVYNDMGGDQDGGQEPFFGQEGPDIVLCADVPETLLTLEVRFVAQTVGGTLRVLDSKFEAVSSVSVDGPNCSLPLKPGFYLLQVEGSSRQAKIELTREGQHVEL